MPPDFAPPKPGPRGGSGGGFPPKFEGDFPWNGGIYGVCLFVVYVVLFVVLMFMFDVYVVLMFMFDVLFCFVLLFDVYVYVCCFV